MERKKTIYQRIGLHYPSGIEQFRTADFQKWKPAVTQTGAGWIVVEAENTRAVPEAFLRGWIDAGVQPVLHMRPTLDPMPSLQEFDLLLNAYAKWGLRYVILFDRPNTRSVWPASGWTQNELVERFLDRFLPLADAAWQAGITPVLSPLEPGGSYWDSAFLRSTLGVIQRRKSDLLRGGLAVSAYAWTHGRSLDWGAGGPERWPSARPYLTPAGSQDQRGFRIYDWYRTISQAVLGYELPIFLLEAGSPAHECVDANTADLIARLLYREDVPNPQDEEAMLEAIPDCVFGAAMRLPGQPGEAAFDAVANRLNRATQSAAAKGLPVSPKGSHPIRQYVLLPSFEWGVSEWHLDAVKPFVRKHRPVVGFSVDEALLASSVLVIGNENEIPEQDLDMLRQAGCKVERIDERGTSLASLLAER